MASRVPTCVSCTLCFSFLVAFTAIGLTAIVIGFVGLGLYIPTSIIYNSIQTDTCLVIDHEYDTCYQDEPISGDPCFSTMWSVEYLISNSTSERLIFSTITQTYRTPIEALDKLKLYKDSNNYTCYYHNIHVDDVQWDKPTSPIPYLIMVVVGFSLTGIYFTVIGIITICRCRRG